MKSVALVLFGGLALAGCARADTPSPPYQYVSVSSGISWFYFTMVPKQHPEKSGRDRFLASDGFGVAYELLRDGNSKELWRSSGWYSFEVHLSPNGEDLVAMGPWNELPGPKATDVALTFFHRGQFVKQYTVLELVRDRSKIRKSVSHYSWRDDGHRASFDVPETFSAGTCDGLTYDFDPKTGAIKYVHSP
jgi:hypothetical protein